MNNRLEEFVRDHREEFDTEQPDTSVWEKISRDLDPDKKKPGRCNIGLKAVYLYHKTSGQYAEAGQNER